VIVKKTLGDLLPVGYLLQTGKTMKKNLTLFLPLDYTVRTSIILVLKRAPLFGF